MNGAIKSHSSGIKKSKGEKVFEIAVYLIATLFCLYCLFPFAIIIGSSFETEVNFANTDFRLFRRILRCRLTKWFWETDKFSGRTALQFLQLRQEPCSVCS